MKETDIKSMQIDPFKTIGDDWLLVTAANGDKLNSMTASWGGLGVLWDKNVAFIFLRPQRKTKAFIDNTDSFSLSVLDKKYRPEYNYLGTVTGNDGDKTPYLKEHFDMQTADGVPYMAEADTVLICKKLFAQDLVPESIIEKWVDEKWYPDKDYHTMYVAEITKVLTK